MHIHAGWSGSMLLAVKLQVLIFISLKMIVDSSKKMEDGLLNLRISVGQVLIRILSLRAVTICSEHTVIYYDILVLYHDTYHDILLYDILNIFCFKPLNATTYASNMLQKINFNTKRLIKMWFFFNFFRWSYGCDKARSSAGCTDVMENQQSTMLGS